MGLQRYKEILQKPEKHLLKTAKDMLRCFFRQLYISAYARTLCLTPGCQTYQDPDVRHAKTRVSDMPSPGCQTCQDPGVGHAKTRVSDIPRPGCRTYQDPGVGHIPYANPVNSLRKGKAFLLKEAKTSGQIPAKDKRQNKKQTK